MRSERPPGSVDLEAASASQMSESSILTSLRIGGRSAGRSSSQRDATAWWKARFFASSAVIARAALALETEAHRRRAGEEASPGRQMTDLESSRLSDATLS